MSHSVTAVVARDSAGGERKMKIAATFWAFRGEESTPEWPEKKYKSDLPLSDSDRCRSQLIIFCGGFLMGVYNSKEWDGTWRPPLVAPC